MAFINLLELVYPVDSIYLSTNSQSPAEIIGGVWESVEPSRYLMAAGNEFNAGSKGASNLITLTVDQMPSHTHTYKLQSGPLIEQGSYLSWSQYGSYQINGTMIYNTGGGRAHSNMPAYYAIYTWRRIS